MVRNGARRFASLGTLLAAAVAVAYLVFFLFGPTFMSCSLGGIGPSHSTGVTTACRSVGWLEMTLSDTSPVRDFRALWFLGAWTLAPIAAFVATRRLSTGAAFAVVAVAFVAELTSIISMGGGFVYALLCGPLLALALVALLVAFVREQMG